MKSEISVVCPRCSRAGVEMDSGNPHLCVDCVKAENSRYSYLRQHQEDWMEIAAASGLQVWEQQPRETQWEFTVWTAYRDAYPGKRPSYGDVAVQLSTTRGVVGKIAQRWTFQARMQAWIAECDRVTLAQRRQEMLDMNAGYIDISKTLREKLTTAVDSIVPELLKPGEIATLLKTAAELERKAQVDNVSQRELMGDLNKDAENPNLKKGMTKKDDLGDVVKILAEAGVLGSITQIGVRQTTTTEVLAKTNDKEVLVVDDDSGV